MKKITLLLSFVACILVVQAQNLLVNPSFETWTSGTAPDGWILTTTVGGTVTKVTTTDPGQTGNALQVAGSTGTYSIQQNVVPPAGASTFSTTDTYQLSVSYLVTAGDGTDARVWCGLLTSAVGATAAYYAVPTTHADSLLYYIPFHGPGGNIVPASGTYGNDLNGYLLDNRTSAIWHTYSCDVKFPAGITQFNFAVRQYAAATVIWDNLKFGLKGTLDGINTPSAEILNVKVIGNSLKVMNSSSNTAEIFNATGAKVKNLELINGTAELNLNKGLYIVRIGQKTAKIIL
jgi:hypothetical protein